MGSFEGAKICDGVGLFILNQVGQKFGQNIGLYKDYAQRSTSASSPSNPTNFKKLHPLTKIHTISNTS